jgi:hypothetical protein
MHMKKVLAFSLYGNLPRYTVGAVKNALLAESVYPGWECWFYCADDVPENIRERLLQAGARIIPCGSRTGSEGMFWRFFPFAERDVSHVLVRDTDSRISPREASAVNAWLANGVAGHIIRDHPAHSQRMMGGLWGARTDVLRPMRAWIDAFGAGTHYNCDQEFLAQQVYPVLLDAGLCVHDAFFRYEPQSRPVPLPRENDAFIGEVLDENDNRPLDQAEAWQVLRALQNSRLQRLRFARHRLRMLTRYWRWRCSRTIRS